MNQKQKSFLEKIKSGYLNNHARVIPTKRYIRKLFREYDLLHATRKAYRKSRYKKWRARCFKKLETCCCCPKTKRR